MQTASILLTICRSIRPALAEALLSSASLLNGGQMVAAKSQIETLDPKPKQQLLGLIDTFIAAAEQPRHGVKP